MLRKQHMSGHGGTSFLVSVPSGSGIFALLALPDVLLCNESARSVFCDHSRTPVPNE
jgi:hypothetical protein